MKQYIHISKSRPNQGELDFSHLLDAPAGKHGFCQAKNGHLYFEDGTRARFLGFNIAARSNTPDHALAEKLAARFASLGVNLIRLHAADAPLGDGAGNWSSCREAPLLDYDSGSTRIFNPEGLDRLDYLIAQLKAKGIYLHIDLMVARQFLPGDGLEYPGGIAACMKRYPMYNERLIELQKEYAEKLLCHVNPYTGLALKDDPAVVVVQMNNEESAIKGNTGADAGPEMQPYKDEVGKRFGAFLLSKYHTREKLAKAWTHDGVCALGEDEDPEEGTVRGIEGGFYQSVNDPNGPWDAPEGPARYADWMEFGIKRSREFYGDFKDYLISLGVKVPIDASNLVTGAADVYSHTTGDVMENNTYFNHPLLPVQPDGSYLVAGPTEYVSANPLTMQRGIGSMATTLLSLASVGIVRGKPFLISEWNEYALHHFHSTAFVHTIAYACLNDWDGLILYNHHTSDKDDQPDDEILTIFDAYNDPALIAQWGFMAEVFLKGLVSPAKHKVDVVYTQNDIKTLPNMHAMPMCFLPYITGMRNVFLDAGTQYQGSADVAVSAGFLNDADLTCAGHAVYYAWSPYRDAMRRYRDDTRLPRLAKGGQEIGVGITRGEQALVFQDIQAVAGSGDYRAFAETVTDAMHAWGVLDEGTGYVDGKLISDTGELTFDPDHARFAIHAPGCGYFSGAPEETISLGGGVSVHTAQNRISLALLPLDGENLENSCKLLLTAIGETATDGYHITEGPNLMGIPFTNIHTDGKIQADTLEGAVSVAGKRAKLIALSAYGEELQEIPGTQTEDGTIFQLNGDLPALQYRLEIL